MIRWPKLGIWRVSSAEDLLEALSQEEATEEELPERRQILARLAVFAQRRRARALEGQVLFLLANDSLNSGFLNDALMQLRSAALLFEAAEELEAATSAQETLISWAERVGAKELALEAAEKTVELMRRNGVHRDLSSAMARYGRYLMETGEEQKAWEVARSALAEDDRNVETLLVASDAAAGVEEDTDALDFAERALEMATTESEEGRSCLAVLTALPWPDENGELSDGLWERIGGLLDRGDKAAQTLDDATLAAELQIMRAVRTSGGMDGATLALAAAMKALTEGGDALLFARGLHVASHMAADGSVEESEVVVAQVFNALRAGLGAGHLLIPMHLPVTFGVLYHVIQVVGSAHALHHALEKEAAQLADDLETELAGQNIVESVVPAVKLMAGWLGLVTRMAAIHFSLVHPDGRAVLDEVDELVKEGLPEKNADLLLELASKDAAVV